MTLRCDSALSDRFPFKVHPLAVRCMAGVQKGTHISVIKRSDILICARATPMEYRTYIWSVFTWPHTQIVDILHLLRRDHLSHNLN